MAYADVTRTAQTGGLSNFVARVRGAFTTWRQAEATRSALNGLTDRELDDIGLSRGDIEAVVARGAAS